MEGGHEDEDVYGYVCVRVRVDGKHEDEDVCVCARGCVWLCVRVRVEGEREDEDVCVQECVCARVCSGLCKGGHAYLRACVRE